MKQTKTIERSSTPKNFTREKGIVVESMVSNETCSVQRLFGTYVTIPIGSQSPLRCHDNAELAWYVIKGEIRHILVLPDGTTTETVCGKGAAGYVAPGDAHREINNSTSEAAEMVLAYANPDKKVCNCFECLGTRILEE